MGCDESHEAPDDGHEFPTRSRLKLGMFPSIDFSNLNLRCIQPRHLSIPSSVRCVNISNNLLSSLPSCLDGWNCVVELNISANRFVRIPDSLSSLPQLTSLNCSNNPIARVGGFVVLENMKKMTTLNISWCQQKLLPSSVLTSQVIVSLDVSFNDGLILTTPTLFAPPLHELLKSTYVPPADQTLFRGRGRDGLGADEQAHSDGHCTAELIAVRITSLGYSLHSFRIFC